MFKLGNLLKEILLLKDLKKIKAKSLLKNDLKYDNKLYIYYNIEIIYICDK